MNQSRRPEVLDEQVRARARKIGIIICKVTPSTPLHWGKLGKLTFLMNKHRVIFLNSMSRENIYSNLKSVNE